MLRTIVDDLRQLLRGPSLGQGTIVLLDQGLLSLTSFLTGVLIARANAQVDFASYVLALSFVTLALSAQRALIYVPFTVYLPRTGETERDALQGSALVQSAVLGVLLACGLMAVIPLASRLSSDELALVAQIAGYTALIMLPVLIRDLVRNAFFARLQFFSSLAASLVGSGLQLAAIVLLFLSNRLTVQSAMLAIFGSSTVAVAIMFWTGRKRVIVHLARVWPDFRAGWKISRWVLLNVVGWFGASQAIPWLLLVFTDASSVAIFGAAMAVASVTAPFLQAANAYVLPRMSHGLSSGDLATLRRMLRRAVVVLAIPCGLWAILGSVYADELMTWLYSARYSGHALVVGLLMGKMLVENLGNPLNAALIAIEKPQVSTQALLLGTLVTLGMGPWLIQKFGLAGAAWLSLVTTVLLHGYKYLRYRMLLGAEGLRNPVR